MKKIVLLLIFLTSVFAQSVSQTEITEPNLQEAVFYSRNVYQNTVFVGDIDATSDRDGLKIQGAVNTIAQAVTVANSLNPSSSKQVNIFVVDGRTYNEVLTLPNYVNLIGIGAVFQNITSGATSSAIVQLSTVGAPSWGGIGGTLSNQTDLQDALDAKQDTSSILTNISELVPLELALFQFNSDTLRVRSLDSIKVDLALTPSDVGLGNVTNHRQLRNTTNGFTDDVTAGASLESTDIFVVQQSADNLMRRYTIADIGAVSGGESNVLDTLTTDRGVSPIANPSKTGVSLNLKKPAAGSGINITTDDSTYTISSSVSAPLVVLKTANESVSSSTTMQDDDHLFITLEANSEYLIEIRLFGDNTSNGRLDYELFANQFCQIFVQSMNSRMVSSGSVFDDYENFYNNGAYNPTSQLSNDPWVTPNLPQFAKIEGRVQTFGNPPLLRVRWTQSNASGTTTVRNGSYLKVIKVN